MFHAIENMKSKEKRISLPVFSMEYKQDVQPILKAMGMTDVFDKTKSSLPQMTKEHTAIYEDAMDREGWISISPHGLEAAAMTGDGPTDPVMATNFGNQVFHADKPFIYLVLDRATNTLLFMGRVTNPHGWKKGYPPVHGKGHGFTTFFWIVFWVTLAGF